MNAEIKEQLSKYMNDNGYYNTHTIMVDGGMEPRYAFDLFLYDEGHDEWPELARIADQYNKEKEAADEAEEERRNNEQPEETADEIIELAMNCDVKEFDKVAIRRAESTKGKARQVLTQKLGQLISVYKNEIETVKDLDARRTAAARYNRVLELLTKVGAATKHGDDADQTAYITSVQPVMNDLDDASEEELAKRGL